MPFQSCLGDDRSQPWNLYPVASQLWHRDHSAVRDLQAWQVCRPLTTVGNCWSLTSGIIVLWESTQDKIHFGGKDSLVCILGIGQVTDIRDHIALCLLGTSVVMSSVLGGNRGKIPMRPRASPIHRVVKCARSVNMLCRRALDKAANKSNAWGVPHEHVLQDLYLAALVLRTGHRYLYNKLHVPNVLSLHLQNKRTPKGGTVVRSILHSPLFSTRN